MGTARPPPARFGQGLTSPHKVDGAVHVCTCRTRSQLSRRFVPIAWTLPSPIACCHFYSIAPARLPATLPHGPLRAALGGTVTPRPSTARPSPQQPSSTSLRALGGFIPAAGRACFLCHSPLSRSYYNRSFCYRLYAALSGPCTSPLQVPLVVPTRLCTPTTPPSGAVKLGRSW